MEQISTEELQALRQQAAAAIPWSNEAHRLAHALHRVNKENPALRGDPWQSYFEQRDREQAEEGRSPALGPAAAEAEAKLLKTLANAEVPDGKQ